MTTKTKTKPAPKAADPAKPLNKSRLFTAVAEKCGMSRKDVDLVYDAFVEVIDAQVKAVGLVTLPGLMKIKAVRKEAVPAREGVDPFTKAAKSYPAKPASVRVKAVPLKGLKDAVVA